MPEVFVGVGSNAEPEQAIAFAVAELARHFGHVCRAPVYRSAAVGPPAAAYLNTVVAFRTDELPDALEARLAAAEDAAGRRRDDAAVCRLDLDLLLYGRRVDGPRRLPRPGILRQPFVLRPLADLAPEVTHPLTGQSFAAAWAATAAGAPPLARVEDSRASG